MPCSSCNTYHFPVAAPLMGALDHGEDLAGSVKEKTATSPSPAGPSLKTCTEKAADRGKVVYLFVRLSGGGNSPASLAGAEEQMARSLSPRQREMGTGATQLPAPPFWRARPGCKVATFPSTEGSWASCSRMTERNSAREAFNRERRDRPGKSFSSCIWSGQATEEKQRSPARRKEESGRPTWPERENRVGVI